MIVFYNAQVVNYLCFEAEIVIVEQVGVDVVVVSVGDDAIDGTEVEELEVVGLIALNFIRY